MDGHRKSFMRPGRASEETAVEASVSGAGMSRTRLIALTVVAMVFFAANSVFCRVALSDALIDPTSFMTVRVASAAAALVVLNVALGKPIFVRASLNWQTVVALFVYFVGFSWSYVRLDAGTGALVLFGAAQLTMFVVGLYGGERLPPVSWGALAIIVLGLLWLLVPGAGAPDPHGAVLMGVAGVAWAWFSLLAKHAADPVDANASAFLCCVPLVLLVSLLFSGAIHLSAPGLVLALVSGAITSGLGYVIWYMALRALSRMHAASVQLSIPVIASLAGLVFLAEPVTLHLVIASIAVLGGIGLILANEVKV